MKERVRAFTLLVPGPWREPTEVLNRLATAGISARPRGTAPLAVGDVELELIADDHLGGAFAFGRGGPLPDDLRSRIDRCGRAVVVDVALRLDRDHAAVAALGRALRDAGGLALRMELSAGVATWDWWLPRIESGQPRGYYDCGVVVVRDGATIFTCGMHHFDRPDAEIALTPDLQPRAAIEWLDLFHIYSLIDDPIFAPGQTFQPDAETKRRVMERWPDARHATNDGRHNPFGIFRFLESSPPRSIPELVPMIIPSLAAMLMAQESAKQSPLTKQEVETITAKAAAMTMTREHARGLERSRGYADIDPELAWEQWQIVRSTQSNG